MKGLIRIGGAIVLGVLVILVALVVVKKEDSSPKSGVVVIQEEYKKDFAYKDEDNNGVPDWQENLGAVTIKSLDENSGDSVGNTDEYTPPETLTGEFSVAFMKDYLDGKISGNTIEDPEQWVGGAIEAIERSTKSKTYTRRELNIVETSGSSLFEYGNTLVKIVLAHPINDVNVAAILDQVLKTEEEELLEELIPIRDAYAAIVSDTLKMSVPSEIALEHVALLNSYEALLIDYDAMQYVLSDPLYPLARLKSHGEHLQDITQSIWSITAVLGNSGVVYPNTEPGSYLYLFDS